jgi:hypothetical protein
LQQAATHAQWHEVAVAPCYGYEAHGEAQSRLARAVRVTGMPTAGFMRAALARHDDGVHADGKNAANRGSKIKRTHGSLLRVVALLGENRTASERRSVRRVVI